MRLNVRNFLAATSAMAFVASPALADRSCVEEIRQMLEAVQQDEAWPQIEREFSEMADEARVLATKRGEENCYAVLADMRRYLEDRDILVAVVRTEDGAGSGVRVDRTDSADTGSAVTFSEQSSAPTGQIGTAPDRGEPPRLSARPELTEDEDRNVWEKTAIPPVPLGESDESDARRVESAPAAERSANVTVVPPTSDAEVTQPEPKVTVIQPEPSVTIVRPEASVQVRQQPDGASSASPAAQPETVAAAPVSSILVREVLFGFDEASLTSEAREVLQEVAEAAEQRPDAQILLSGHTDSVGSADYNMELSKRRVSTVAEALSELGINDDRIETRHFGQKRPEVESPDSRREQQNRRVEIRMVDRSV